ncbi:hypothetical protein CDA63_02105 [Hymenobacter amundsenii]|uniref:Type IX secretion system membrane protein PorP/SprF n=1 Tax=Hymenobacter amundsenii TaxID=2006685 RepID=A0A246FS38_9BACT|nr:hypothetical protein CDA63_02105 [Hymenobacter amundsenii]
MRRTWFRNTITTGRLAFCPGRWAAAAALCLVAKAPAVAQDLYFAQPYANRMQLNPAYAGQLDDYSITLSYRNQFPTLAGTFQTTQLAADYRFRDQHSTVGLLISQDRSGAVGYTRLEAGGVYAYHVRLGQALGLSGGASLSYGRQRVSYGNLVFGDQLSDDGQVRDLSQEATDYLPVNYLTAGGGGATLRPTILVWGFCPPSQPAQLGLYHPNPATVAPEPARGIQGVFCAHKQCARTTRN